MDNWSIVLGGVTVGLVALYFTPALEDYIKSLTSEDHYRAQRLKAKYSQGLWQLVNKDDIQEYIMNHHTMKPVASLLKTCGNSALSPPTPSTAMSPGSPISTPKPQSPMGTSHVYDDIQIDSKFLPSQHQFDLFITDLANHLSTRPEFNQNGNYSSLLGGGNTPAVFNQTKTTTTTSPTTLTELLTTSIITHHAINLAQPSDTIEQLQKLYLFALRQDSHPDFRLQAYWDLYSTSTALRSLHPNPPTPPNTTSQPQPQTQTITQSTHNALPKQERITWTPSQENQGLSGVGSEDLSTMTNRTTSPTPPPPSTQSQPVSTTLDNLTAIVPGVDLVGMGSDVGIIDTSDYKSEITYPSIYSGIDTMYQISTFASLLQNVRKIKVEHAIPWHEKCLEILWDLAPIYEPLPTPINPPSKPDTDPSSSDLDNSTTFHPEQIRKHVEYKQLTEKWGDIGFQGRDPGTDFRGCGLLGLLSLVCFAIQYPDDYKTYVIAQQERGIGIYGLAITCINITATLVDYTQNHVLTPIYIQEQLVASENGGVEDTSAVFFATFVKLHAFLLKLLFAEWNKRTDKFNVTLSFSSEQKHRALGSSPSQTPGATSPLQRGLTVMDFPHVFKDILVLFKKQIYQNQVKFD